jgi:hypothetical protein
LSVTCDRSVVFYGYSSTNKTDRHDITEILLKVALNTINHKPFLTSEHIQTHKQPVYIICAFIAAQAQFGGYLEGSYQH